ncbi:hypothetical protein SK128_010541, partial [Halocaridina rubra]
LIPVLPTVFHHEGNHSLCSGNIGCLFADYSSQTWHQRALRLGMYTSVRPCVWH